MSPPGSLTSGAPSRPVRLLLVDDDDVDREKFRRLVLKSGLDAEIVEAASGREALERLSASEFDSVVVDYRLGDTCGTELVRRIKDSATRPVPIIMITGLGDERIAVEAMREGVYDYLSKNQLQPQHLLSAIEGSLRWAELEGELAAAQERLRRLSLFDSLTGLPNRNLFFDRLEQLVQSALRSDVKISLMMIDLNQFKEINDTLGHGAGDKLLAAVGQRLARMARTADTYARLGGDEFAALLVGCGSIASAVAVAERIHAAVNEPVMIEDEMVRVTGSIGVALFPDHGRDSRTLLAHADQAMYRAKHSHGICEVYSAGSHETRPFLIASQLSYALERHELFLEYQPKVDLGSGELVGVEALVRWQNPRLGLVAPNDFIPSAERCSLIKPFTYAILAMALDQVVAWRAQGTVVTVAVNLSARMFDDVKLAERTCCELKKRQLEPESLTYEITETALMASPLGAQEILRSLRDARIGISIDDFGAGYTSLKYLRDFDIAEIKIDKMFITDLQRDSRDATVVRSIAELTRGFDLRLVAEGIEDENQVGLLRELGCDFGQGFAVGRPMAAGLIEVWQALRTSLLPPCYGGGSALVQAARSRSLADPSSLT